MSAHLARSPIAMLIAVGVAGLVPLPSRAADAPDLAASRALWEGGAWQQDFAHGGGYLSGYKDDDEYMDLGFVAPNALPLTPKARAQDLHIRSEMKAGHSIFAPYSECHPPGMPYIFTMDGYGGWNIMVGSRELIFFYPNNYYRVIHTDGRPHVDPRTTKPTYNGDSVGRWENGVFIVDTVNLRGSNTQYEPYVPKSEGVHIVERYTPAEPGVMKLKVTIESADFTRPWVVDLVLTRHPEVKLRQGLCTDANRYRMTPGKGLELRGADGKPLAKAED